MNRVVLRSDDVRRAELEDDGWVITARSWAAQLNSSRVDSDELSIWVRVGRQEGDMREIGDGDVDAVLTLDSATLADYPGGIATEHTPLTRSRARVNDNRRAFGVFDHAGVIIAITFVDIDGPRAETDFTVVAKPFRGRGLGRAIKAFAVLTLLRDGVEVFRTGGAEENAAIRAANLSLGYEIDEEWVTLSPPPKADCG